MADAVARLSQVRQCPRQIRLAVYEHTLQMAKATTRLCQVRLTALYHTLQMVPGIDRLAECQPEASLPTGRAKDVWYVNLPQWMSVHLPDGLPEVVDTGRKHVVLGHRVSIQRRLDRSQRPIAIQVVMAESGEEFGDGIDDGLWFDE